MLPPFAPEELAPRPVRNLQVSALENGMQFVWTAPEQDIRGEPLRSLDYYQIERKTIIEPTDVVDESVPFKEVGTIADTYFEELKKQQRIQVARGLPRRKASVDESYKRHVFVDSSVTPGSRYLYRVMGVNQGDEAGAFDAYVDVEFSGLTSSISLVSELEEADATSLGTDDNPVAVQ